MSWTAHQRKEKKEEKEEKEEKESKKEGKEKMPAVGKKRQTKFQDSLGLQGCHSFPLILFLF